MFFKIFGSPSPAPDLEPSSTPPGHNNASEPQWAYALVERLALASLQEQRRARRWGIFFKLLTFIYLGWLFYLLYANSDLTSLHTISTEPHTALVEISGIIAEDAEANADTVVAGLRAAFEDENTAGIILRINSPGGSPVQSRYIYSEIIRLREKYPDTPLYAVITDLCASGGYYIAAAADEIYADKASLVGSIGVLMNGFGFVDAMAKLGVERRLLTAGEHKGMLDPFSPENPQDKAHFQRMLAQIHQQFIDAVKEGRSERIQDKEHPEIYSGLIWSGEEAEKLGLIDGFGSSGSVARDVIKAEEIVDFTVEKDYLDKLAERLGASAIHQLWTQLSGPTAGLR